MERRGDDRRWLLLWYTKFERRNSAHHVLAISEYHGFPAVFRPKLHVARKMFEPGGSMYYNIPPLYCQDAVFPSCTHLDYGKVLVRIDYR
jgi:hypothetical protein